MTTPDALGDAELIANVSDIPYEDYNDGEPIHSLPDSAQRKRKEAYLKSKSTLLGKLLHNLDIVIYCQLSALYYMDCSILHFAIRALVQFVFLTPKQAPLPEPPMNQPFIGAVLSSNLLCILLHCLSSSPAGGEASRGYLHGGLFIDFVGEHGPISKLRMALFDLLIFALQLVMLGIILEKEYTRAALPGEQPRNGTSTSSPDAENAQDHDSEERGVLRSQPYESTGTSSGDDIELQDMTGSAAVREGDERSGLLADSHGTLELTGERDRHPRDPFMSGEAIILDMDIVGTFRSHWHHRASPSSSSAVDSSSGVHESPAARFLQSRFGFNLVIRQ